MCPIMSKALRGKLSEPPPAGHRLGGRQNKQNRPGSSSDCHCLGTTLGNLSVSLSRDALTRESGPHGACPRSGHDSLCVKPSESCGNQ